MKKSITVVFIILFVTSMLIVTNMKFDLFWFCTLMIIANFALINIYLLNLKK